MGSGADGELQSAASYVDGFTFVSVFAATLKSGYQLHITEVGIGSAESVAVIEANATDAVTVIPAGGSLAVPACGKSDFRLYSLSPVLPNGE